MIYPFLIIIIIELAIDIYFHFKSLPREIQKEVLRKIEPVKGEIIEWEAPASEEEIASKKIIEELQRSE